jgi:hypothetical protein
MTILYTEFSSGAPKYTICISNNPVNGQYHEYDERKIKLKKEWHFKERNLLGQMLMKLIIK